MKNEALQRLDGLVGTWKLTMTHAWFLDDPDLEVEGQATIGWLGDAFLELRATLGTDQSTWHWIVGRSDARERFVLLYHDERGVLREFDMTKLYSGNGLRTCRARPEGDTLHSMSSLRLRTATIDDLGLLEHWSAQRRTSFRVMKPSLF